jgi:PPK2 family polyphosphate:nucleotide phosphotransferase
MKLSKINTGAPKNWNKEEVKEATIELFEEFGELHKRLVVENKQSLLLVLQGMDASGKDGLIRDLFCNSSPAWVQVKGFKKPTVDEYKHDFLWRIENALPASGLIGVFNRSHYEDILVPSVYGYIEAETIEKRYAQINAFEEKLEKNGTRIVKCYLHIDFEKQEKNLLERITDPSKYWKHNDSDWDTRLKWEEFMNVYQRIFQECSKSPWHIIPSDKNWVKLFTVLQILINTLQEMNPQYPALVSERFGKASGEVKS